MKLLNFKCKNLFSLGEVEIDLAGRGLTLITGFSADEGSSNGAGKSSLANKAVLWVLFGETAGGIRADAVSNRHTTRGCFGELTFTGSGNETYRVVRARPASLSLFRDGTDVSAKTAKDTQVQIDQALGIDFKTFLQTSFFGQGRTLSYASLPPKDQKAVLESILPMEEVDKWAKYADEQYRKVNLESIAREQALRQDSTKLDALQDERTRLVGAAEAYESGRVRHLDELSNRLASVDAEFAQEKDQLEILKKQIGGDIENDLIAIEAKCKELVVAYEDAKQRCHEADRAHDYWVSRGISLRNDKDEISKARACPTCLRAYDSTTVDAIEKRVTQTDALIAEAETNTVAADQAVEYYNEQLKSVSISLDAVQRTRDLLKEDLGRKQKIQLEEERWLQRQESRKAMLQGEIRKVQMTENPMHRQIENVDGLIVNMEMRVEGAQKWAEAIQGEAQHLDYWRNVYAKELKLKLFEEACPFLDARVEHHLKRLNNGQIHVEFSTVKRLATGATKEEFSVNVWSETGGYGFDSLSGGEQQMVSFSIGLGLADLAQRTAAGRSTFLILDEPFAELDARNSESIVQYLSDEVRNGKDTIFLISNDEALKGLVANRIHVVKKHGISGVSDGN